MDDIGEGKIDVIGVYKVPWMEVELKEALRHWDRCSIHSSGNAHLIERIQAVNLDDNRRMPRSRVSPHLPEVSIESLWKHMANRCAVPLVSKEQYKDRKAMARELWEEVNAGSYSPARLHGFLSAPKAHNVARFVPVFTFRDTSVYFACVKQVDQALASEAVTDTFGGWQLGGAGRSIEEAEALKLFGGEGSFSIPQSCYNRGAWVQNWNQFWKLLAARHELAEESAWFAMFDIANFYDSIDLRRLETAVRAIGTGTQFPLNVLFHLLRSWNRAHCLYADSTKGLPMDIVGDCSRLLANYFLTPFDRVFREHMNNRHGDYMRFADDMVVRANTRTECEAAVYEASDRLHRLGLNINVAKVTYCSKDDFDRYWGFVIMDRFESGEILGALSMLKTYVDHDAFGRKATALKRAVTLVSRLDASRESAWWKTWVRETALAEGLPLLLSREQLCAFVYLYEDPARGLELLLEMFLNQPFTQPKAVLLRMLHAFPASAMLDISQFRSDALGRVKALNDPVLQVCVNAFAA